MIRRGGGYLQTAMGGGLFANSNFPQTVSKQSIACCTHLAAQTLKHSSCGGGTGHGEATDKEGLGDKEGWGIRRGVG